MQREMKRQGDLAGELMAKDHKLPFTSALVIAGDLLSVDRSLQWLREGKYTFGMAEAMVGSYGRLDFRVKAYDQGLISPDQLIANLPDLWSGSDPDDTDPRFLSLWKKAWGVNGGKYLRDGKALPRRRLLTIYRGQDEGAPFGIAWSLDAATAKKFANGAATRQPNRAGVVYVAQVERAFVLGYMTGRGEAEVVVDPTTLIGVERL